MCGNIATSQHHAGIAIINMRARSFPPLVASYLIGPDEGVVLKAKGRVGMGEDAKPKG
jgi:hypothetical protein